MRLGRVGFVIEYVVDLDDEKMVEEAIDYIHEDVINLVKFDEFYDYLDFSEDKSLKRSDIPAFLLEDMNE